MFTWLPMSHLPNPPDVFVQQAHDLAQQAHVPDTAKFISDDNYRNRLIRRRGNDVISRYQQGRDLGPEWAKWVGNNIIKNFIETGLRVSEPVSDTHGAHTDPFRKWKLYYLLERGGPSAVTCFYRQKGHDIVRDQSDNHITCDNIDQLEIIDQVQWPMKQWVLLNTMILHGVSNVQGYRYNLTVSIKPQDLRNFYIKD